VMTEMGTDDAARQLAEIEARQGRALRRVLVPRWYWWAVGAAMVALGWIADTQPKSVIVVAALLFAAAVGGLSVWAVVGGMAGARVRGELMGPEGAVGIVLLDFLVVGGALGVAFSARALGWPYPATIGTACGALLLAIGGPFLMSWLERLMRGRTAR
jgi:hypothetical protein